MGSATPIQIRAKYTRLTPTTPRLTVGQTDRNLYYATFYMTLMVLDIIALERGLALVQSTL